MNKTAIKNFAIRARVQLIEAAKQRAYEYEITENGENKPNIDLVNGRLLTESEKLQRSQLLSNIRQKGYTQVMEEAAYTWFNRFIALRFMEVNGYLPSKLRVFTDENGVFKPDILKEAMTVDLEGLDRNKVHDLLDKQNNEELYKYLLITQCNALNGSLPYMFEKISNWTELLFPANLLRNDSVIDCMISEIPEEDWKDAIQIIGWLYQFYNSELKDDTFAKLKKNIKISKERIPSATQLFTPEWIVRYMVENSLGRLWYEGHRDFDKSEWKYYLEEAEQEPEVEEQLKKIREEYSKLKPEDIKIIDPCVGSGHILVYAFEVLMQIYTSAGWSERDAARSIIENNLYGLDIDDRAGQLAYFAVMMKARKYSRRILNENIKPNIFSIQESNWMTDEFISFVAEKDADIKADLITLRKTFKDAKEYGSILKTPVLNYDALFERIDIISRSQIKAFQMQNQAMDIDQLLPLVKQAQIMSRKYDVVITNPPYMGSSNMNAKLSDFVKKFYPDSKSDLFAVFIERGNSLVKKNRFNCMVTMQSWMFLTSFEAMRTKILASKTITTLMHMENMVMGIAFGTAVSVFINNRLSGYKGTYNHITLKDIKDDRPASFPVLQNRYSQVSTENFSVIPGSPVAYWVSDNFIKAFKEGTLLGKLADSKQGIATADNNRFLRLWSEVNITKVKLNASNANEAKQSNKKWFPYNKGGDFRRWYGNNDYLVNWENDGYDIKHILDDMGKLRSRPQNLEYMFRQGITWTTLSSGNFCARYCEKGYLFDTKGSTCFFDDDKDILYGIAFLNSKVVNSFLQVLAPTLDYNVGSIAKLPLVYVEEKQLKIDKITKNAIDLSQEDWDAFETSLDFKKHPLI
jgi:hypothetical protein